MEIPYRTEARPDTGLWNAKIGIWLFLASEVMLFGGLFSGYVFLRMGADYPWPENVQNWQLGAINTAVLIISSVTVVFAWASLKLERWKSFVFFISITILCALGFLFLKLKFEYAKKLKHQAFVLQDRSIISGHEHHEHSKDKGHKKASSVTYAEKNKKIYLSPESATINLESTDLTFIKKLKPIAGNSNSDTSVSFETVDTSQLIAKKISEEGSLAKKVIIKLNDKSLSQLKKLKDNIDFKSIKLHILRKQIPLEEITTLWINKQIARIDSENMFIQELVKVTGAEIPLRNSSTLEIKFPQNINVELHQNDFAKQDELYNFAGTLVKAEKLIPFEADEIDTNLVEIHNNDGNRNEKLTYEAKINSMAYRFWHNNKLKNPHLEKIDNLYNSWLNDEIPFIDYRKTNVIKFKKDEHQLILIPENSIWRKTVFGPSLNTYFAIYYTITGLHALHVLGGAVAFIVFLVFGKKWYRENPTLFTNRIEITGLFWHFVDLVWIFAFPIFYLF